MRRLWVTSAGALLLALVGSAAGLGVNLLRHSFPFVAPFPYEQDCPEKLDLSAPTVDGTAARVLLKEKRALFIDARPAADFDQEHLPGARSIPLSMVAPVGAKTATILAREPYQVIVVYCDSPRDGIASLLAKQLKEAGLTRVKVLRGGLAAYRNAGGAP